MAALVPLGVVTSTLAVPAEPAGVTAVIEVELTETTLAAAPPMVTLVAPVNPVPVIVTDCPPPKGPLLGLMDVTVGAAQATTDIATSSRNKRRADERRGPERGPCSDIEK